uniref:Amidohydrolase-related domain-containing protein n=1 Tax=Leersia perrieri TaxID=77586 RepID=A0A0D9W223_9ORYZ
MEGAPAASGSGGKGSARVVDSHLHVWASPQQATDKYPYFRISLGRSRRSVINLKIRSAKMPSIDVLPSPSQEAMEEYPRATVERAAGAKVACASASTWTTSHPPASSLH